MSLLNERKSMMRRALESIDGAQVNNTPNDNIDDGVNKTIVMKGPLSEIYTKALNMAYAKHDKLTGKQEPVEDRTIVTDTKTGGIAPPASPMLEPVALESLKVSADFFEKLVVSLESQAIDATLMERLSKTLANAEEDPTPTDSFQTVYGVSKDAVEPSDLIDVAKEVTINPPEKGEYILIIDRTNGFEDDESPVRAVEIGNAMECIVEAFGGHVFHSLEDFVQYQATRLF